MLDNEDHRRYSNLSSHDDIGHSSGSASGSGASIHTPSTVHTAIISILPPTTASTANFPLDIFPSPPQTYNELGPLRLRSRPSTPNHQNPKSHHMHGPQSPSCALVRYQHRRRFSEPTRSREIVSEQRRYTMSFDLVSLNGASCQERVLRVGFPQKRRSSVGSLSLGLALGTRFGGNSGVPVFGDGWKEGRAIGASDELVKANSKPINTDNREEGNALMCVYDGVKRDKALDERTSAPCLSSASRPEAVSIATIDAPLWPSLPSGPSSPNFTSFTCQQDTLPRGRVLSGFSDINYSLCSFSVDDHGDDNSGLGVKGDISPTIPVLQFRPDSGDIAVGISSRPPRSLNRPRPAPLPLSLSLGPLPTIPSASEGSAVASTSVSVISETKPASASSNVNTVNTERDTRIQPGLIGKADSFSSSINQGDEGNKVIHTTSTQPEPYSSLQISNLAATRNLPLVQIDKSFTPSNGNQHPSTRSKGIVNNISNPGALAVLGSTSTTPSSTEISVPILASPISIYSHHSGPPSPKSQESMPLSLNRSHQDWDHQGKLIHVQSRLYCFRRLVER
jgi:hypothetical protein